MNKVKIKEDVICKLDSFSKDMFEDISFKEDEKITESKKYMSIENVRKALNECFDVTYDIMSSKNNLVIHFTSLAEFSNFISVEQPTNYKELIESFFENFKNKNVKKDLLRHFNTLILNKVLNKSLEEEEYLQDVIKHTNKIINE